MRKHRNLIILLVMAALVAASLYFIIPPGVKTHLGLDLQGGLEIVYTAKTSTGAPPSSDQMDQTVSILNRRVNGLGVTESAIQKQGTDQVSVSLPGITNTQQALNVIGKTAQLEFYYDDPQHRPVGPVATKDAALKQLKSQGASQAVIDQLSSTGTYDNKYSLVEAKPGVFGNNTSVWFVYKRPPAMTGDAISKSTAGFNSTTGKPNVLIDFTAAGSKQFQDITRNLYRTGLLKGQPQTFAIVLDNVMSSDPQIDYTDPTLRDGISGGAEISGGNMTVQDSKDLALVLNIGALPVRLAVAEQRSVSATLGKDSLHQGLIAGMIGLGIVLIYMLAYYRFLGLVADLALIVYGILLWGLFNAIPVTLTLPGIAGMILTIGVAADANVVIFERIKEEVRHGKTVRSAVNSGYARGFKTILDANILTMLTAAVIFVFATAQPKGFALTLILGVLVSMLTAVLFTRAMLGVLAGFAFFSKPAFMGVRTSQIEAAAVSEGRTAASRKRRTTTSTAPAAEGDAAAATAAAGAATAPAQNRGATTGSRTSTSRKKKKKRR
ncbi:MAG TPA: protein translocase subunit SecD [Thermoleophilia bacterium]|nr:protein translocase subunit SecD [Thermoleophilia bacterium]